MDTKEVLYTLRMKSGSVRRLTGKRHESIQEIKYSYR